MTVKDVLSQMFASASENIMNMKAEDFCKGFSQHIDNVKSGIRAALHSYISKLELFSSMSIADIFHRISENVDDSHNFFLILLVFSFGLLMTFVGVRTKRLFVLYPFVTGCVYFLFVSPILSSMFLKQTEDLYSTEATLPGMQNLVQFARQIDFHLIVISFVLASIVLYFYNMLKYIPALAIIAWPWNVFISDGSKSADYMMFAVFAIFSLYVYSKVFNAIERIILAVIFSFVGSFILVAHVNIVNSSQGKYTSDYEEFLESFSMESEDLHISNICSILFLLTFVLGVWCQLDPSKK